MNPTKQIQKVIALKILLIISSSFFLCIFLYSCNNPEHPNLVTQNSDAAIAYSSDNGVTWNIQYVSPNSFYHSFNSITSMDNGLTLSVLTDYAILRSDDTGSIWTSVSQALFKNKIISTGVMNSGVMIDKHGNIEYTTDNGKTFSSIISGTTHDLNDIVIDSKTGYGYIAGEEIVLKTTDYGQTWFKPSGYNSLGGEYYFNSIAILDSDIIYVKGYKIYTSGSKLVKSYDGFKSASVSELPFNDSYSPLDISFYDEYIGVTGTDTFDGSIVRTSDGGQTWNKINISSEKDIYSVKFIDGICLASSKSKIHRSSDLGLTWTTVQLSDSYIFSDIYSPSPGKIFMCGKNEVINN